MKFLPNKNSFKLVSRKKLSEKVEIVDSMQTEELVNNVKDFDKRTFLKVLGVAGVGILASSLFPKKADALILGSTPASNVVGLKDNKTNARINPATEDKQDALITELQKKADQTETQPVSIAGTVNVAVTNGGAGSGVTELNDSNGNNINPATDESILYLRRMVKLMESQAVVDNQMRQRVVVDTGALTDVRQSSAGNLLATVSIASSQTLSTVSTVTSLSQLAGVDSRWQIIDWARTAYNGGMRDRLISS